MHKLSTNCSYYRSPCAWLAFHTKADQANQRLHSVPPQDLEYIRDLVEQEKVRVVLDPSAPFTLETAQEMLAMQATHRAKGKLVMKVNEKADSI